MIIPVLTACDNTSPASPTAEPTATSQADRPQEVSSTPSVSGGEGTATQEEVDTPTALPVPAGTVVDSAVATAPPTDESLPSPTAVTATGTGEALTALQALGELRPRALAWQGDARLVMLSNVRPGQEKNLLGGALGDPDVNEPTPGGKGRNWTLVAFSPSTSGAVALSMEGTQVDLVKEGMVSDEVLKGFASAEMAALDLAVLDAESLVDSDKVLEKAGERGKSGNVGIALLAPDGLGIGPLPASQAGGDPPQLAYELFSTDPTQQTFIFFDATTGEVVLDSSAP
ncbi:MAG TPA: hypothetical protein VEX13_13845 [Chloroflexia bacterium]|nr:hypothetical protein [Chloroflexia bacterium]